MADVIILKEKSNDKLIGVLTKALQSGNINLLLGSGASMPAIGVAGKIETRANSLFSRGKDGVAKKMLAELLNAVNDPMNKLIKNNCADIADTISNYERLVETLECLLVKRRSNILRRQINIFTTNYDLFIEAAVEKRRALILNDGFDRQASINSQVKFHSGSFFDSVFHRGPVHGYTSEIPSINLIKMHGSISWKNVKDDIYYDVKRRNILTDDQLKDTSIIDKYLDNHCLILPHKGKFRETVKERVYYDLMRIYSNELDRENALLIVFGFSFNDEHIFDITQRALKNPALLIVIFAYDTVTMKALSEKFKAYHNVIIAVPSDKENIGFSKFNDLLTAALPGDDHADN